jgi:hypothetical protein
MIGPGVIVDMVAAGTHQMQQQLSLHMQELSQPQPAAATPSLTTRDEDAVAIRTPPLAEEHRQKHRRRRSKEVAERAVVVRVASSATVMMLGAAGVYSGVRGILQVDNRALLLVRGNYLAVMVLSAPKTKWLQSANVHATCCLQGYQHLRRRLLRQLIAEVCPGTRQSPRAPAALDNS